jgi:hypothetical protein
MRRHGLSIFQSAASLEIGGDASGAEGMTADADSRAEIGGAALDHAPGVDAVHRVFRQRVGPANSGAEQGGLAVVADAGGLDVGVQVRFEIMMRRHLMTLAAFLMQTDPPALALGIVVLDAQGDSRADAGKGERHHRDQRTIAEANQGRRVDAVQQLAGLFAGQHRGLAGFDDVLGTAHRMGRIGGDDLARHQPVEQHADGGQVLLDRRLPEILAHGLDTRRRTERRHDSRIEAIGNGAPDMAASGIRALSIEWIGRIWRARDSRGLAAALIVLIVGGVMISLIVDTGSRSTPMTGLLIVATLFYGIISERLSEFTAPGGWSAKFIETAGKSIKNADAVIRYKSLDVNFLPKGTPEETMRHLVDSHDDTRPLVLTLTLGQVYDSKAFASLLTAFATVPNFRGIAVIGETGRLVAYSSARQIAWLSSSYCDESRNKLLRYIHEKNEDEITKHICMSVIAASNGSSYAEVLRKTLEDNLSCIAIVDKYNKLCGIVDRDRLSAFLVLSLTSSAQGKDAGVDRAVDNVPTTM